MFANVYMNKKSQYLLKSRFRECGTYFKKDRVHGESSSMGSIRSLLVQTTLSVWPGLPTQPRYEAFGDCRIK